MSLRLTSLSAVAVFAFVVAAGAVSHLRAATVNVGGNGAGVSVVVQDDESARIQQMFSHQPTYSRPAPRTWSSRLEIRWSARWQSAPRYAV